MYQLHWVLIFVWGLSWKLDLEEGPRQHKEIFQNLPTNCMRWCFHLELNFTTTLTKNSHTTTEIYLFRYSCIAWTVFFKNLFVLFCEILTAKIRELLFTLFYSLQYSHNQLVEQEAWKCSGTVSLILFFNAWYLDYLPELGMRCTFNAFLLFEE